MRKLLTITCCVGLASLVGAAQHDDQNGNGNQGKKKGQQQQQQQQQQAVVGPQTGKKFKTGAGPHNQNFQQPTTVTNYQQTGKHGKNWQGQGNASSNASNTTFNKTKKFQGQGQGNLAGGGNMKFQKKQFNLQKN